MNSLSQIETDAAMARRLQEEEFHSPPPSYPPSAQSLHYSNLYHMGDQRNHAHSTLHEAQFIHGYPNSAVRANHSRTRIGVHRSPPPPPPPLPPPDYPQPQQDWPQPFPASPSAGSSRETGRRTQQRIHDNHGDFPFVRPQAGMSPADMLSELFRRVGESASNNLGSMGSSIARATTGFEEFDDWYPTDNYTGGVIHADHTQAPSQPRDTRNGNESMWNNYQDTFGDYMRSSFPNREFANGLYFYQRAHSVGGEPQNMNMPHRMGNGMGATISQLPQFITPLRANMHEMNRETYEDLLQVIDGMGGNVNRGATNAEIANLPCHEFRRTISASSVATEVRNREEEDKCAICLGEYEEREGVKILPCTHMFHCECVDRWLNVNRTCPFCKQSIRAADRTSG